MIAIIFYYEDDTGMEVSIPFIDQVAAMTGFEWFIIDRTGTKRGTKIFSSLEEAQTDSRLANHQWVYFDINANEYLEDYAHPANNTVYVIGSDTVGYAGTKLEDINILKLKTKDSNRNWYAAAIIPYVCCQRWNKTGGN